MLETSSERRSRILAASAQTRDWEYDLALTLGYQPESWSGMWSLIEHPFSWDGRRIVVEQVVTDHLGKPLVMQDRIVTKPNFHKFPKGWTVEEVKTQGIVSRFEFRQPARA